MSSLLQPDYGPLNQLDPLVAEWFANRFAYATEPQILGWPEIRAGHDVLISAPTGSGKTLAAFLICIDQLVRKARTGALANETEVVYVSPLKALSNDVHKNLEIPLAEISALAATHGVPFAEIRAAVRTGDTPPAERVKMGKQRPHILVTTPESLFILLTAEKSRAMLSTTRTVIVDEIHAVADDKRGSHLALSLERLDALTEENGRKPQRIGLSATVKPIDQVAEFLSPNARIVNVGHRREMEIAVEVPRDELGPVASNEMWAEIYDRVAELILAHRTTLVFVNTRRLAERVAHALEERLGPNLVLPHHGSLSRALRWNAEARLKNGELRAVVATASLELGIDIGSVELVCQIGSPRSIAVALQRIGRSGHRVDPNSIPKGRLFATTRDELIECAALVRAIRHGDLDPIEIPEAPLDILAQQIVAACAAEDWQEDDLFALVCRAFPFRNLTRKYFDEIIGMLSDGIAARRGRYGSYLHHDQVNRRLRGRRGSRLAAITSGGAIPDNALYTVVAEPEAMVIGTVDEDFAVESLAGDIMLLGNNSWRIRRVQAGSVLVEDAKGAPPNIPFWRGEAPSRTSELSKQVAELREEVSSRLADVSPRLGEPSSVQSPPLSSAIDWLRQECGLDQSGAEQIVEYILAGRAVLGAVPTQRTIIAERFFDESGGMQLVIHAPFGGRINKAWGLALRKRFCRSFNFELQAAATDNGLNISLSEQHSFPLADVFRFLHSASVEQLLEQAVLDSPIFATRWRWAAGRALALLRFMGGKKVAPQIQRMRSDDLLAAVFPQALACPENIVGEIVIPDHPLVSEAMKDSLTEAMDIAGLKDVLSAIVSGDIRCIAVDTPVPSQFSHEILNANPYAYLDDAPLEERRARAVEMRRILPESVLEEVGKLDPAAIAQVREEAWPDVREPDELHDVLHTLIAFPEAIPAGVAAGDSPAQTDLVSLSLLNFPEASSRAVLDRTAEDGCLHVSRSAGEWQGYFERLLEHGRATRAEHAGVNYWVAAERAKTFSQLFPGAQSDRPVGEIQGTLPSSDDALLALVTGWMSHLGPATASQLGDMLGLSAPEIEKSLLRMEATGAVLRGQFTDAASRASRPGAHEPRPLEPELEWCERRLLARIHRLTVATLRKQIEPVTAAQFMRWLLRWQHVAVGAQVQGERATLDVLRQLQGFEIPANAWERHILGRRVVNYDPKWLDQLC